jgi:hypothetical protein
MGPGCDEILGGGDGAKADHAEGVVAEAKEVAEDEAKDEAKSKKGDEDEDKGSAKLLLGDDETVWEATRATAYPKDDGKMKILASVSHGEGESRTRKSLTLVIKDYKGTGSYVMGMSSNLTAVKLNYGKIKKAEEEGDKKAADKEAEKAAKDAIGGASVALLQGAKVEITKADDDYIDGTITWTGVALRGPKKLSGEFHARIKKKD